MFLLTLACLLLFSPNTLFVNGASKDKPHGHKGVLEVYDGKPIPVKITPEQIVKLNKGEPVSL